jgi:hypothetical protein
MMFMRACPWSAVAGAIGVFVRRSNHWIESVRQDSDFYVALRKQKIAFPLSSLILTVAVAWATSHLVGEICRQTLALPNSFYYLPIS